LRERERTERTLLWVICPIAVSTRKPITQRPTFRKPTAETWVVTAPAPDRRWGAICIYYGSVEVIRVEEIVSAILEREGIREGKGQTCIRVKCIVLGENILKSVAVGKASGNLRAGISGYKEKTEGLIAYSSLIKESVSIDNR
jgi:hypothetical protein